MKVILISSMKGGAGVTTIAILIAKYLHSCHYNVAFLDFSPINQLALLFNEENPSFRHYNARHSDVAGTIGEIEENDIHYDFLIVDGIKEPSPSWLYAHQRSDMIVVPYQFCPLDYVHLKSYWIYLLREKSIQAPVYFLANKYSQKKKNQSICQLAEMHQGEACFFPPPLLSLADLPASSSISPNPYSCSYTEKQLIKPVVHQLLDILVTG